MAFQQCSKTAQNIILQQSFSENTNEVWTSEAVRVKQTRLAQSHVSQN